MAKKKELRNEQYYYHGSAHLLKSKSLLPHPSKVINNESAVFATNQKWLALVFIAHATDRYMEIGFVNAKGYILEQEPNVFKKFLKNKSGYIYYVDPKNFRSDSRLGLRSYEFISDNPTTVLRQEYVPDIYKALKKENVRLITWKMKETWLAGI